MAGMGDLRAIDFADFSPRLKALEAVRSEPTLDENDLYVPSPREAELADRVCVEDCVVALANAPLRRQLCLTLIQAIRPALAVIAGQRIGEDEEFLDYLHILLPDEVRVVPSVSSWPGSEFKGVCLLEPEVLWSLIENENVKTADIGVLILRDFEHYLDSCHAYRKIVPYLQLGQKKGASGATRLLALADGLQVSSLDALELDLKQLRTPLKITCCLGTPVRPHTTAVTLELCAIETDWESEMGYIVSCSDDPEVQEVGTTLRERGIAAALSHAEELSGAKHRAELQDFLEQSQRMLTSLKGRAILEHVLGRTLVLATTAASQDDLKAWIEKNSSVEVITAPDEAAPELPSVLVATMADMPTVKRHHWNAVILSELPYGVSCDALLTGSDHKVVLATEPEWKSWQEALNLHDDLEKLIHRVNQ